MRGLRLDRYLAGTALALALAVPMGGAIGQSAGMTDAQIEAAIPLPEPANIPPPSKADVERPGTGFASPATASSPARAIRVDDVTATAKPETASKSEAVPAPAATDEAGATPPAVAAPADPVAEKLRELVGSRLSRLISNKSQRDGVAAFYGGREFAPLWIEGGAANTRAKAAVKYLAGVAADGLEPADYPTPQFRAGSDPAALAEDELRLTVSVLTFARHAQTGRVHFSRISADIFYELDVPEAPDVLAKLAAADDVGSALDSFNPPHAAYKALKAKLKEARGGPAETEIVRIPEGAILRPGSEDARVVLVRKRLDLTGDPTNERYDDGVAGAVKSFQESNGLNADGMLGPATLRALNGGPRRTNQVDVILANMERWRWIPRDLGKSHVVLNIPDFTLKVYRNGTPIWHTKVVVGKQATPTPLLSDKMKYITVNPTWNVPPSIVYNEYLPALQQDPTVLERMGLRLTQNRDGSIHISQPPGDRNALGRIRFNFPNRFLVYQHDTPDKNLFAHDKRAYSHGCMRVQDPLRYAEVLLSIVLPNEGYTQERLRRMYGNSEIDIKFPTQIPVHITYQTAFVDEGGKLVVREDIYGRDARVLAALKGDDRRYADIAMDRPKPSYARPPVSLPYGYGSTYASAYSGGPNFFERLFGGGPPPTPPAPIRQQRRHFPR
jgi:murein L,D-transpeptidase YcbB/YkuD